MRHPSLLERKRAALVVIDMQEGFRPVIPAFEAIAARIAVAVQAANLIGLPVIVTEQYPKGLGRTVPEIAAHFRAGSAPIEKLSFSACGAAEFDLQLREHHAEQAIVCGIEAHICVSQTAHDLLQNGYQVHLLTDAVATRLPQNLMPALHRMERAGALLSSVEMALFEMFQAGTPEFKQLQTLIKTLDEN
ncbi:MAG: isochorismatase family protein [Blastocatellia bacterium]|nr:isochorismatase family protein [Blastocatellia bacterium]